MDSEQIKAAIDASIEKNLATIAGEKTAQVVKETVRKMRLDRELFGRDKSGLDEEQKSAFAADMIAIGKGTFGGGSYKAALLETVDSQGGYTVPVEVHRGILRIAASNGYVLRDAMKFPMSTDEMNVPRYAGSDLEGAYYTNDDTVGTETDITFGTATLAAKTWYTIFRVSNPLLADASADIGDFLLALAAEGLANMIDKQAFAGTGSPFTGLLADANVTQYAMATTADSHADFTIDDAEMAVANLPASLHQGAAWYMHPTMWAHLKTLEDTAGQKLLGQNSNAFAAAYQVDGIKPSGVLAEYPVYLSAHFPAYDAGTSPEESFIVFANLNKAIFFGDRERLSFAKSDSATVGGKNVFAANQTAFRVTHRHAITVGLPAAAVVVSTGATS